MVRETSPERRLMLLEKTQPHRDPDHLKGFQHRECLARGYGACGGDVVGHHIRGGNNAMGRKPDDRHTVPLCHAHHMKLHAGSEREFWIELFNESSALWDVLKLAGERLYYGG